jgi:hypothetical protein
LSSCPPKLRGHHPCRPFGMIQDDLAGRLRLNFGSKLPIPSELKRLLRAERGRSEMVQLLLGILVLGYFFWPLITWAAALPFGWLLLGIFLVLFFKAVK